MGCSWHLLIGLSLRHGGVYETRGDSDIVVGRGFGLVIKADFWIRGGDHRHPRGSDSVEPKLSPNTRLAELAQGVVSGSADLPWR
ncbi:tRNA G37 N-methylase TrmD [Pseudomonas syringae pv. actinidiae]|uniref:tRNA G37 N-methylase TrmD n=1 Tax=Pseudomonas syringae pv. actinidiae TaxID=103796 RepID=A0AAN4Q6U9_PSESF|nr:tRNA G37 N-methylase TrmD [Pseudomonas syringae pv. actinidiae]